MKLKFAFAVSLNVVCSVGLIFLNKIIFVDLHWPFATSLTAVHFLCNYLACELFVYLDQRRSGWSKPRNRLSIREAVPMAICWAGSIVFANLSLLKNTTGFYQASKLMSSPVLVVWQWVFFGVTTDYREMLALIPLICGIALITVSDVRINAEGLTFAGGQLLAAAAVQTWVKSKQINQRLSATELLLSNSLICFVITVPVGPFVDYALLHHHWIWKVPLSNYHLFVIILSAVMALGMNIACFLIIGISDPLTFQVVGYLKTMIVFVGGAYIFDEGWGLNKLIGIAITVLGLIIYRTIKLRIDSEEGAEEKMIRKWTLSGSHHKNSQRAKSRLPIINGLPNGDANLDPENEYPDAFNELEPLLQRDSRGSRAAEYGGAGGTTTVAPVVQGPGGLGGGNGTVLPSAAAQNNPNPKSGTVSSTKSNRDGDMTCYTITYRMGDQARKTTRRKQTWECSPASQRPGGTEASASKPPKLRVADYPPESPPLKATDGTSVYFQMSHSNSIACSPI